jgi:cell division protein FtsW
MKINVNKPPIDYILLASTLLLLGIGLVTLYSGYHSFAEKEIINQIWFSIIGLGALTFATFCNLESFRGKNFLFIAIMVVYAFNFVIVIPGLPFGGEVNGASRWFYLGPFHFQPSELIKLVLPFYLASRLDKKQDEFDDFIHSILPLFLVAFIFLLAVAMQNNFSTALFLAINIFLIFFMARVPLRYLVSALVVLLCLGTYFFFQSPHHIERVFHYIHRKTDLEGAEYQPSRAVKTIVSGGFWGKGLGQGSPQVLNIPEIHKDFIYSVFAEEFGFFGVILFFILAGFFMLQGYLSSFKSPDMFRRLIAFSYVTLIASQTFSSIAINARLLPTTGLPMPFFSAGGSSLVVTLAMCGVLLNVSRYSKPLEARYSEASA